MLFVWRELETLQECALCKLENGVRVRSGRVAVAHRHEICLGMGGRGYVQEEGCAGWVSCDECSKVSLSFGAEKRNCGFKMTVCCTLQACAQAPAHAGQQRPLQHHPVPHLPLCPYLPAAGLEQLCAGGGLLLRQTDPWVSGSETVLCGELGTWPGQRSS